MGRPVSARRSNLPISRETRLAGELEAQAKWQPSSRHDDQLIILVHASDGQGGICMSGYDDPADVVQDLLVNALQIAEANGIRIDFGLIAGRPN